MSFYTLVKRLIFSSVLATITGIVMLCPQASAGIPNEVVRDFKPVPGYVVLNDNGEILIDRDAASGTVNGDIFSVISSGKKIIHPITGEGLGNLEETTAYLRVTRIRNGFSHTQVLSREKKINAGDPIRRYEGVKAVFWDYTGSGKSLFLSLKNETPHMKWIEYDTAQMFKPDSPAPTPEIATAVVFILSHGRLGVRGPDFTVIREYDLSEATASAPPAKVKEAEAAMWKKEGAPDITPPLLPVMKAPVTPAKSVRPVFHESNLMKRLPGEPVIMSDFVAWENGLLFAATDGGKINIYRISDGDISFLATQNSPVRDPIIFLSWWQPHAGESPVLTIVNYTDHAPSGTIYAWTGKRLSQIKTGIPYFIGAFDADGDRRSELLLGQHYAPEDFFGDKIKAINITAGGDAVYTDPPISIPKRFTVSGSLLADITGTGHAEAMFIRNKILYIFSGETPLYKSSKQMGGSLSMLTYDVDPHAMNVITNTVPFELPPVAVDLDGDGVKELLAVASEQTGLGHSGISPGIKQSWLAVFKYQDGLFNDGTLGKKMSSPIQGMTVHEGNVLLVMSDTGSLFSKGGRSRVVALPLAR